MAKTKLEVACENMTVVAEKPQEDIKKADKFVYDKSKTTISDFLNGMQWCEGDYESSGNKITVSKPVIGNKKLSNYLSKNGVYAKIEIDIIELTVSVWVLNPLVEPNYVIKDLLEPGTVINDDVKKANTVKTAWYAKVKHN